MLFMTHCFCVHPSQNCISLFVTHLPHQRVTPHREGQLLPHLCIFRPWQGSIILIHYPIFFGILQSVVDLTQHKQL